MPQFSVLEWKVFAQLVAVEDTPAEADRDYLLLPASSPFNIPTVWVGLKRSQVIVTFQPEPFAT